MSTAAELPELTEDELLSLYQKAKKHIGSGMSLERTKASEAVLQPLSWCVLCLKKPPVVKTGHLMPAFVFRYVAEKRIELGLPSKIVHAAHSEETLNEYAGFSIFCGGCEQLFRKLETTIAPVFKCMQNPQGDTLESILTWSWKTPLGRSSTKRRGKNVDQAKIVDQVQFDKLLLSVIWRDAMLRGGTVLEIRRIAEVLLESGEPTQKSLVYVDVTCERFADWDKSTTWFVKSDTLDTGEQFAQYHSIVGPFTCVLRSEAQAQQVRIPWVGDVERKIRKEMAKNYCDMLKFLPGVCDFNLYDKKFSLAEYTNVQRLEVDSGSLLRDWLDSGNAIWRGDFCHWQAPTRNTKWWFVFLASADVTEIPVAFSFTDAPVTVFPEERSRLLSQKDVDEMLPTLSKMAAELIVLSGGGSWVEG